MIAVACILMHTSSQCLLTIKHENINFSCIYISSYVAQFHIYFPKSFQNLIPIEKNIIKLIKNSKCSAVSFLYHGSLQYFVTSSRQPCRQ